MAARVKDGVSRATQRDDARAGSILKQGRMRSARRARARLAQIQKRRQAHDEQSPGDHSKRMCVKRRLVHSCSPGKREQPCGGVRHEAYLGESLRRCMPEAPRHAKWRTRETHGTSPAGAHWVLGAAASETTGLAIAPAKQNHDSKACCGEGVSRRTATCVRARTPKSPCPVNPLCVNCVGVSYICVWCRRTQRMGV